MRASFSLTTLAECFGQYGVGMRAKIVRFETQGLVLQQRLRRKRFTVTYGEILSAERLRDGQGLRLHTRTSDPIRLVIGKRHTIETESLLRLQGVSVVDCWGALLTPTLADFEDALERGPEPVRQSYDNA